MKFQVFGKDNQCRFVTESKSCIPCVEELTHISKAGYKFKLDGKSVSLSRLKEELKLS